MRDAQEGEPTPAEVAAEARQRSRKRPEVFVHHGLSGECQVLLRQVLAGLEEEGVPFRTDARGNVVEASAAAHEAAGRSPLGVGVAVTDAGAVALHYKDLPPDSPLFSAGPGLPVEQARILGTNAARLAKGVPFKLVDYGFTVTAKKKQEPGIAPPPTGSRVSAEELARLAAQVALRLLEEGRYETGREEKQRESARTGLD